MAKKKLKKKELIKNDWFILIIPVVIIVVLIAAVFGVKYFYKPKEKIQTINFNGFIFTNESGIWKTQMQMQDKLYDLMFKYNPYDVENITINYRLNKFSELTAERRYMYITFDPEDDNLAYIALAAADLTRALTRVYGIKPVAACTKNITDACSDVPIKTCETTSMPVIYIDDNPIQNITYKANCLTIQGEKDDLLKAVQRVLFDWYKIMPDE